MDTNNDISEQLLVESMRKGSIKAFNAIYRLYVRRLINYLSKATVGTQDAEEIVQEIFLYLWNHRENIDPRKSLSTLLYSWAYKRRIDIFRKRLSSPIYEDYLEYQNIISSKDNYSLEYKDFLRVFNKIIESLPSKQRQMIVMSRLKGMSNTEIAIQMGLSEKTVRNGLSAGLKILKDKLARTIDWRS